MTNDSGGPPDPLTMLHRGDVFALPISKAPWDKGANFRQDVGLMSDGQPLMRFKSHIEGKNADVAIWPDRIEWTRVGFLTLSGRKDTNVIPIRAVQGVATHKAGLAYTTVDVTTSGDHVRFRVTKAEAQKTKDTILRLMFDSADASPTPATSGAALVADELAKLAQLRESGVLSEEEFQAQKTRLLGG